MISRLQGDAPHYASSQSQPEAVAFHFLKRLKLPCRLLVAYSGGGDSTGLLVALSRLRANFPGLEIIAATVDHGLRADSTAEAFRAGDLCQALGIQHAVLTWLGDKPRTGIQAAGRSARYRLIAEHAAVIQAGLVVTAHNLEDQQETLAMRRARDPAAVAGISEAVLVERSTWVVRPFLEVHREAIRAYLRHIGIGWTDDPSNDNPAFERVRIRQGAATSDAEPACGLDDVTISHEAAGFLDRAVRFHPGMIAEIDLHILIPEDPAHRLAILSLMSLLGGRDHLPGSFAGTRVFAMLADGGAARYTAGRVVLEKRDGSLFVGREARGLPTLTIAPGATAYWDNRLHVVNEGTSPASVESGTRDHQPLVSLPRAAGLPASVLRRAEITIPRLVHGDASTIRTRIVMPQYEHFLPSRRLPLANTLASLAGLEHFPSLSLG